MSTNYIAYAQLLSKPYSLIKKKCQISKGVQTFTGVMIEKKNMNS